MFWIVLMVPLPLSEKLVLLKVAIPFVPLVFALSRVMLPPEVRALLKVIAPVRAADPPVVPVIERTPVFEMVTAPVAPETLIPDPATFEVTPVLERVRVPPRDTGEPPTP